MVRFHKIGIKKHLSQTFSSTWFPLAKRGAVSWERKTFEGALATQLFTFLLT
jgi:hypothetical protein